MPVNEIYVIGAGGHAKVVAKAAISAGFAVASLFDDDKRRWGDSLLDIPITGPILRIQEFPAHPAVIGIGNNQSRFAVASAVRLAWQTVIDPHAYADPSVFFGEGVVVLPGAVVQIDSHIGNHVIVNTSASIDHDCRIGDFVHIAPGVHLAGNVEIGNGAFLGIGSVVIPGIKIGAGATIGAGTVVIRDVPDRAVVVGVPGQVKSIHCSSPFC